MTKLRSWFLPVAVWIALVGVLLGCFTLTARGGAPYWLVSLIVSWLPFLALVGVWLWFSRRNGRASSGASWVDLFEQQVVETQRTNGEFDRAIADCSQAIALCPQYRDAYYYRGYAYLAKGDADRAIADYDQIIALDPKDSDARSSRASAYLSRGDFHRAIADFGQGQVLLWLATIVLLAVIGWLCSRTGIHARRWSGWTMIEVCEQQIADMQLRNAALERIAAALEGRSLR